MRRGTRATVTRIDISRDELFFIVEGTYELTVGDQTTTPAPAPSSSSQRNVN